MYKNHNAFINNRAKFYKKFALNAVNAFHLTDFSLFWKRKYQFGTIA